MLGLLDGVVDSISTNVALVIVQGVGYEVHMPVNDIATLRSGMNTRVYTSLSVSQDALTLYGFLSPVSKNLFLQLQKVNGVGPKAALSVLSTLSAQELEQAINNEDVTAISKTPGIGKKGAQKIILELKGSISVEASSNTDNKNNSHTNVDDGMLQVINGLESLGWKYVDARYAVEKVCEEHDIALPLADNDIAKVLKLSLHALDRGR
ncbi:MAG: Holliday junction branch migration protein RuvA [Bifidobacteriaceae bacterium]|nr:Holliday junction branch migration protein RuvA [Bifidobacteriaceae bacterium]